MSYILDALQRAEAERERGHVPGLKSQLVPPAGRDRAGTAALRPWHVLVGLAAVLIALVALAAWWWTDAGEAPPLASAPLTSQPDAVVAAAPAPPLAAKPAVAPEPIASTPEPVQPILAPPRPAPAAPAVPATAAPASAAPAAAAAKGATPPAPAPTPAPAATATAPATPASAAVPSFGELTADARAQLPAVNVSGSTYSQNPSLRMLIANGKVVQEGQDIAPGLRLETIGPRNAVLNHQGLRYSIGY
jgi:general secretion pathway protein B